MTAGEEDDPQAEAGEDDVPAAGGAEGGGGETGEVRGPPALRPGELAPREEEERDRQRPLERRQ